MLYAAFWNCVAAGWQDEFHSKYHWLVHLPKHLARSGFLPSCRVHERKHRVVKRYANDVANTVAYEKSAFGEVLCHNLADLEASDALIAPFGLIHPKPAPPKLVTFLAQGLGM